MILLPAFLLNKAIMSHLTAVLRASLAGALCLALQPAQAASGSLQGAQGYYQSCLQSVNFPRPFGEWDLKGNAKLPQYCECHVPLFTAHTTAARELLSQHGGAPTPEMIKENKASELGIRNSCRKKVGLPAVYDPNVNSPYAKEKRANKRTS
jgi:hypothetical protein